MIRGTVKAYSKINIGLIVGDKRSDGFHEIDSYFARTSLSDNIHYCLSEAASTSVRIEGNESYLASGDVDIMEKAARNLSSVSGKSFELELSIEKHIPSRAGLGGGSSDAASVILLLGSYFHLDEDVLYKAAEMTGSDVPFFISGYECARVKGRGEKIEKAECPDKRSLLILVPDESVSTKDAYRVLDSRDRKARSLPDSIHMPNRCDFPNDFELIGESRMQGILKEVVKAGDYYSLSGSGSSWFILADGNDIEEYEKALGNRVRTIRAVIS